MNFPRHPKAKHFHELGLMEGVQSFSELESRIAALPSEQARGAALEIFAEACLATQRIYQAREVWPGNSRRLVLFGIQRHFLAAAPLFGLRGINIIPD